MDKTTISKSRPTTAKVRVEIDLIRPLLSVVNVEFRNTDGKIEMFTQKVKYDLTPFYCSHCKVHGHYKSACRVLHPELRIEGRNIDPPTNNKEQSNGIYNRNKFREQRNSHSTNWERLFPQLVLPRLHTKQIGTTPPKGR